MSINLLSNFISGVLIIIFGIILLLKKLNYKKEERYRNAWFISTIILFVFLIFCANIPDMAITQVSKDDRPILILFVNLVIFIIYLFIKLILFFFKKPLLKLEKILRSRFYPVERLKFLGISDESGIFYLEKNNQYFLKKKYAEIKKFFYYMIFPLFILFVFTVLSNHSDIKDFSDDFLKSMPIYYSIGILLFLELYWFFDGNVEPVKTISSDSVEIASQNCTYQELTEEYTNLWNEYYIKNSLVSIIEQSNLSVEEKISKMRPISKILSENSHIIYESYFFSDIDPSFFSELSKNLMRGKKIIVLCKDLNELENCDNWVKQGLSFGMHSESIWNISIINEKITDNKIITSENTDILICTSSMPENFENISSEFISKIKTVIIIDANSVLFSHSSDFISISKIIMSSTNNSAQFIFMTQYEDGSLSQFIKILFNSENIEHVKTFNDKNIKLPVMIWKEDVAVWYQTSLIQKNPGIYLNPPVLFLLPALKNRFRNFRLIDITKFPIEDDITNLSKLMHFFENYLNLNNLPTLKVLQEIINIQKSSWNSDEIKDKIVILHDKDYNIPKLLLKWKNKIKEPVLIHILSPQYLLRDYFTYNLEFFTTNPDYIPKLMPEFPNYTYTLAVSTFWQLKNIGIAENTLAEILKKANIEYDEPINGLSELFIKAFNLKNSIINSIQIENKSVFTRSEEDNSKIEYKNLKWYKLKNSDNILPHNLINNIAVREESVNGKLLDIKTKNQVFQNFCVGRNITYYGENYKIRGMDTEDRKMIILKKAPKENNFTYMTKKSFALNLHKDVKDAYALEERKSNFRIRIKDTICDLDVRYEGNFIFYSRINAVEGYYKYEAYKTRSGNMGIELEPIENIPVLEISIKNTYFNLLDKMKVAFSLSVILNELFKTFFPDTFQYISACAFFDLGDMHVWKDKISKNGLRIFSLYPYIRNINREILLLEDEIRIFIIDDSGTDNGIIATLKNNMYDKIFPLIEDYLYWMLKSSLQKFNSDVHNIKTFDFLTFGYDKIQDCFEFPKLLEMLEAINEGNNRLKLEREKYLKTIPH